MHIIVCLDDHDGMLFNGRRQSQDQVLRREILQLTQKSQLWMNCYSAKQFEELPSWGTVDNDFLLAAPEGAYCFVENENVLPHLKRIDQVVVYRWNRVYPADQTFPAKQILAEKKLLSVREFAGNSHDLITEEIYA